MKYEILLHRLKPGHLREMLRTFLTFLTNDNGESLIKPLMFPSQNVNVTFSVDKTEILIVYDLNLGQFMGIILGARLISSINCSIDVTIYRITREYTEFIPRPMDYDNQHFQKKYFLTIFEKAIRDKIGIYYFENIDFASGFVTPFNWINDNNHKYWSEFREISE